MATPGEKFPALLHDAVNGGAEISLEQLFEYINFATSGLLERLQELQRFLVEYRLKLNPDITLGELADQRLLTYSAPVSSFAERLHRLRGVNELVDVEFKSTAFISLDDQRRGEPLDKCQIEGVIHSLLKAICGFINKDGGEIYVGVERDGTICGIQPDFLLAKEQDRNFDGWSNRLTDQIISRFHEGAAVMRHVDMQVESFEGLDVVRIQVLPRIALAFLKKSGVGFACYVRQNVRVVEYSIEQLPDLLEMRRAAHQ